MKDKWMNMGYEDDELKPYIEPLPDLADEKRIDTLVSGFCIFTENHWAEFALEEKSCSLMS